jgi:hypothetical protein
MPMAMNIACDYTRDLMTYRHGDTGFVQDLAGVRLT